MTKYPEPTIEQPSLNLLFERACFNACGIATDGCICKTKGCCEHGHQSWLVYLELL